MWDCLWQLVLQCVCANVNTTTCWALAQSSSVSIQCQLVSTSINSLSSWLPLPSQKIHLVKSPCKVTLQENCLVAVCGADLGSELTTSSLRQKSSLICLRTSFSLLCINPQAWICTALRRAGWGTRAVYFLWRARIATPRTGQLRPQCFIKSIFLTNALLLPVL